MARYRDRAPIGYTCPNIDSIIAIIEGVADRLETLAGHCPENELCDDLENQASNLRDLIVGRGCAIEELRNANDCLRLWGNDSCQDLEAAEVQIASLESRINELENL